MFDEPTDNGNGRNANQNKSVDEHKLPLGIEKLDNEFINGVHKSSVIVVLSNARLNSALFLLHAASTDINTQYISTTRTAKMIRKEIKNIKNQEYNNLHIHDTFTENDDDSSFVNKIGNRLAKNSYLLIEGFNNLKLDNSYTKTTRNIKKTVENKNSVAILTINKSSPNSLTENETKLLQLADTVFQLETQSRGGKLEKHFKIYKMNKAEKTPDEIKKLSLGKTLKVENSREF